MIDARISIGLPTHPKTKKLIRRIGTDGAWRLVCLFLWAAQNRPDGDLAGLSSEDVELAVDWGGEPDAMVKAMIDVGFLEGEDGSYRIHDWEEHNPWASGSEERSWRAKWKALVRHHGKQRAAELMPEYVKRYPSVMQDAPQNDAGSKKQHAGSRESAYEVQCEQHEAAMQDDAESNAPSPLPNPLPLPLPNPNPNPNPPPYPLPKQKAAAAATEPPAGEATKSPPPLSYTKARAETLAVRLMDLESKRLGRVYRVSATDYRVAGWAAVGVSDPQFREAYDIALDRRNKGASNQPISPSFLDALIREVLSDDATQSPPIPVKAWYETASGIEAKGKELGVPPPSAEAGGFPAFKARVHEAVARLERVAA